MRARHFPRSINVVAWPVQRKFSRCRQFQKSCNEHGRSILDSVSKGVESESHVSCIVSAIKIYDTFERSALKIPRRVFVSCSRGKACNFSELLTFCSEAFLEKLSPLKALRNYGDR